MKATILPFFYLISVMLVIMSEMPVRFKAVIVVLGTVTFLFIARG